MSKEFTVEHRVNDAFDSFVALSFALEGSGAALMAGSVFLDYSHGVAAGLALVASGIVSLLLHLGNRLRSWRVVTGFKSAWISRGALFTGLLLLSGILHFLPKNEALGLAVKTATVASALFTILYSGFLLSSMTSIPLWNSLLTPVLFLMHSATTGTAALICMLVQSSGTSPDRGPAGLMLGLAGGTLLVTLVQVAVMATSSHAARESIGILVRRGLKRLFLGGAVALGLIVPLILFSYIYFAGQTAGNIAFMFVPATVSRFIGDYAFRSSLLRAGVFEVMI